MVPVRTVTERRERQSADIIGGRGGLRCSYKLMTAGITKTRVHQTRVHHAVEDTVSLGRMRLIHAVYDPADRLHRKECHSAENPSGNDLRLWARLRSQGGQPLGKTLHCVQRGLHILANIMWVSSDNQPNALHLKSHCAKHQPLNTTASCVHPVTCDGQPDFLVCVIGCVQ